MGGVPNQGADLFSGLDFEYQGAGSSQAVGENGEMMESGRLLAVEQSRQEAALRVESLDKDIVRLFHGQGNIKVTCLGVEPERCLKVVGMRKDRGVAGYRER